MVVKLLVLNWMESLDGYPVSNPSRIMLYQESGRESSALWGFSLGKADILRRAMGKKKCCRNA